MALRQRVTTAGRAPTYRGAFGTGLAVLAPILLLAAVWVWFAVLDPTPYWQQGGDYSWYALSQAFTLEAITQGQKAYNIGYNVHPGLPFGMASWLSFRISTLGLPSSAERIGYALDHADRFWLHAKTVALILNIGAVLVFWRYLTRRVVVFWAGVAIYFAVTPASLGFALLQLTNESFTLLVIIASYAAVDRFYSASALPRPRLGQARIQLSDRDLSSLTIGALAGFGCTIKIYYLAPAIAFAIGAFVAAACGVITWRALGRAAACAALGFFGLATIFVSITMGWSGFTAWLGWNWSMLNHTDRYGTGQPGFASLSAMASAFSDLSESTGLRFPIVLGAVMLATLAVVARGAGSKEWREKHLGFSLTLIFGAALSLFALLKHYSPLSQHYALPLCATLACLLVLIGRHNGSHAILGLIAGASTLLMALNVADYAKIHTRVNVEAARILDDQAAIERLPITPEQKRVWVYFSSTKPGIVPLINQYAGSAFIAQAIAASHSSFDIAPNSDPAAERWKYVIFPKFYFPTEEAVRTKYRSHFDLAATRFTLKDSDSIAELSGFFVLTRASP